jgi:hypothetical protein
MERIANNARFLPATHTSFEARHANKSFKACVTAADDAPVLHKLH